MGGGTQEKSPHNTTDIYRILNIVVNVDRAYLLIAFPIPKGPLPEAGRIQLLFFFQEKKKKKKVL